MNNLKRGKYTPNELLNEAIPIERMRKKAPDYIVKKVIDDIKKLEKIPFKKKTYEDLFWGENPYNGKLPSLTIDLPIIDIKKLNIRDVRTKAIFETPESLRKKKYTKINKSCIITHNNEIIMVYVRGKDDKAIYKATKHFKELGEQMMKYYPEKAHTFYSGLFNKQDKESRYYGWNALDGFIRYLSSKYGNNIFTFHPRNAEAQFDLKFLYNLMYSYSAIYALEKRWAPAIAQYRLDKAKKVNKVSSIPPLPLEILPATSLGVSLNFASSLHDDSGVQGITETIAWEKVEKGKESYFVNDEAKMYFDIGSDNCFILIPPKIAHGTVNTGEHNGLGFVIITKQNLIADTDLTKKWYNTWRGWLDSNKPNEIFEKYKKEIYDTLPNKNMGAGKIQKNIKVKLYKSPNKQKKYRAIFYKGDEEIESIDFGAKNMSDFTINKDEERKQRYIKRHQKNEDWENPYTAGSLSRWVLWEKPDLKESWKFYKKKFGFK